MSSHRNNDLGDFPGLLSSHNESQQLRIGIFDSGVGGLTVLRELYRQLPNESFLYFADTARLPYGTRSQAEILKFTRQILSWMTQKRVKMAIMACNTSSALALDIVRDEFDIPILGLILPGARAAVQQGKRIGVIATPATVASDSYRQAVFEIDPTLEVWQVSCPDFVPLIEQNQIYTAATAKVARTYLEPLIQVRIDTLIYGCTHYPHLAPVITSLLPHSVHQVDPAAHVVAAAAQELEILGLRNTSAHQPTQFFVSGCPEQFAQLSLQWLGYIPRVEQVSLPVVSPLAISIDAASKLPL